MTLTTITHAASLHFTRVALQRVQPETLPAFTQDSQGRHPKCSSVGRKKTDRSVFRRLKRRVACAAMASSLSLPPPHSCFICHLQKAPSPFSDAVQFATNSNHVNAVLYIMGFALPISTCGRSLVGKMTGSRSASLRAQVRSFAVPVVCVASSSLGVFR